MPEPNEQETKYEFPKEITDAIQQIREYVEKNQPNFHYLVGIAHGDVSKEENTGVDIMLALQGASQVHAEIIQSLKDRVVRKTLGRILREILGPEEEIDDVKTA